MIQPDQFQIPLVAGADYYRFVREGCEPKLRTLANREPRKLGTGGAKRDEILKAPRDGYHGIAVYHPNGAIEYHDYPGKLNAPAPVPKTAVAANAVQPAASALTALSVATDAAHVRAPARTPSNSGTASVFAQFAWKFIERGISVVPIAPGTKKPGQWSQEHGWRGMGDWTRFAKRLPSEIELEHWEKWPDAGIGVVLGEVSNLTCLDKDYDIPNGGNDALQAIIPYSPIAKKGEKGWTRFYQFNGERSCSFDVGGARVLDVLAEGRQTVIPPTVHPTGCSYVWITEESLDSILTTNELPKLPPDFLEQVARVLAPYQTEADIKHQKKAHTPKDDDRKLDSDLSFAAQYFHDLNQRALSCLDDWVPKLVPTAKPHNDGYRCIATWRNVKNANVGITSQGIRDFGGGYGLTATDLVMFATGLTFAQAAEVLRQHVQLTEEPEPIVLTVRGVEEETPVAVVREQDSDSFSHKQPHDDNETGVAPEFPSHLLQPPQGVLRDFMDWILGCAQKPQPILALATSLSIVATVLARKVKTETGLRTNLYLVSVAGTGAGKDHGRKCLKVAFHYSGLSSLVGGEELASGKGLLAAAYRQPATVFQLDEFGLMLKTVRGKSAGSHLQEIVTNLMKLFSSAGSVFTGTEYADQKQRPRQDIPYPCINLHATTTPEPLFESFASSDVASGYINRLLILFAPNQKGRMRFTDIDPPPQRLLDWMKAARELTQGQLVGTLPDQPITIRMSEAATRLFSDLDAFQEEQIEKKQSVGLGDLWSRCWEHASKIALVVACAKIADPKLLTTLMEQGQVVVDEDSARWAIEFVKHVIGRMETEIASRVADSEFGQLVQVTHQAILKAGKKGLTERELGRTCRKYDGLRPFERDAVIETLQRKGEIVSIGFNPASGRGRGRVAWVSTKFYEQDGIVVCADE